MDTGIEIGTFPGENESTLRVGRILTAVTLLTDGETVSAVSWTSPTPKQEQTVARRPSGR
jgi:hypothetical protein